MSPPYKLTLLLSAFWCVRVDSDLIVTTDQGKLRGYELESRNGTVYRAFLGIPYAKPPVGELRFESPQEPNSWTGVRNATVVPPPCVQKDIFSNMASFREFEGSEDCLYLNLYAPSNAGERSKLPVMVHIHGGAFVAGTGNSYLPDYFLDYDVILVFFNYRLGPFGFLSTADEIMPGNYGMKDQVAVLRWVRKNVAFFGGDPQKVTIFGESAGAASVHMHLYSPLSKGLFQRAISQSGSGISMWARSNATVSRQKTIAFGILAGCSIESSAILLKCLRKLPASELMRVHQKFYVWDFEPTVSFSIVAEPATVEGAFFVEMSDERKPINNVPWMTGITSGEGAIRAARFLSNDGQLANELNDNFVRVFPLVSNLVNWFGPEDIAQMTEAARQFYFGNKTIGLETAKGLVDMITDTCFFYPCLRGALQYTNSVYLYYYDHKNSFTHAELYGNVSLDLGVCHDDDLISLFHFPARKERLSDQIDINVSKRMLQYWINFARTGQPSEGDNVWRPFTSNRSNYLHIMTTHDEMKNDLLYDRFSFWNYYLKNNERLRVGQHFSKEEL